MASQVVSQVCSQVCSQLVDQVSVGQSISGPDVSHVDSGVVSQVVIHLDSWSGGQSGGHSLG